MQSYIRPVLFALLLITSCGYHAGDFRTPTEELRIFVPVFENGSVRPLDLNEITSVFRENLEPIRGVIIVNNKEDADLILLGKVSQYDRTWGASAYTGTSQTEAAGGLRKDMLSASTARITLGLTLEKRSKTGELLSSMAYADADVYELSDRLELSTGSAATPQIHASRESLLLKKLTERIFSRARAQIVDAF